jgi:type II secretory pathway component PulF
MIVLALSSNQKAWWVTLAAGLVVALVVWALLELLRRTVNQIDAGVSKLWESGKLVAQNTQTTHLLGTTAARGADLVEEVEHHRELARRQP